MRVACTGAVLVAIAACASLGEMSHPTEWIALLLVPLGMAFSYATRARPPEWVKVGVALGAVGSLVWFFNEVSSRPVTDITTVENPLTVLFVCILVVHSFHVPSRRDLLFSIGASAGLMAVGAAQAIDLHYGIYALAWVGFVLWALIESWASLSHGGRTSSGGPEHRPARGDGDGSRDLPGAAGADRGGSHQLPGSSGQRRQRPRARGLRR